MRLRLGGPRSCLGGPWAVRSRSAGDGVPEAQWTLSLVDVRGGFPMGPASTAGLFGEAPAGVPASPPPPLP